MYEQDYILRLITRVGQMLRALLHANEEQRPDDALEIARDAVEALLETDVSLADALTGEGLVTFLAGGGTLDVLRARMLGEVLLARAVAFEGTGRLERARHERGRARTLLQAAATEAAGVESELIDGLLEELSDG